MDDPVFCWGTSPPTLKESTRTRRYWIHLVVVMWVKSSCQSIPGRAPGLVSGERGAVVTRVGPSEFGGKVGVQVNPRQRYFVIKGQEEQKAFTLEV